MSIYQITEVHPASAWAEDNIVGTIVSISKKNIFPFTDTSPPTFSLISKAKVLNCPDSASKVLEPLTTLSTHDMSCICKVKRLFK